MRPGLTPEKKNAIVRYHLMGYTRNDIVRRVSREVGRVSAGSVTGIENKFVEELEKDVEGTARSYAVSDIIVNTQTILRFNAENGLELRASLEGARLAKTFKDLGIPLEGGRDYIAPVYARSRINNLTPEQVALQCSDIASLEKKYGLGFGEIKKEYVDIGETIEAKRTERDKIFKENDDLEKKRAGLWRANQTSEKELKLYLDDKRYLTSLGLDFKDAAGAATCLHNLKRSGYDAARAVGRLRNLDDLEAKISELKGEAARLNNNLELLQGKVKEASEDLTQKQGELHETRKLTELGLDLDTFASIRKVVVAISQRRKISARAALRKFSGDVLKRYDTVLGFEAKLVELNTELDDIRGQIESAQKRHDTIQARYDSRRKEVEAYLNLIEKGVTDETIIGWNETVAKMGLDPRTVTQELSKYKSLRKMCEDMDERLQDLRKQKSTITAEVEELERRKQGLIASIRTVTEEGTNEIKSHQAAFERELNDLDDKHLKKIESASKALTTDLATLETSVNSTVASVRKSFDGLVSDLDSLSTKALEVGSHIDEMKSLKPVIKFYISGEGTKEEVLAVASQMTENLITYAQKNNRLSLEGKASSLKDALRDEIRGSSF